MYNTTSYAYNPYPMQSNRQSVMQVNSDIVWVQGEEAAKAYPVAPNCKVMLFDSESPVLYVKQTDYSGKPMALQVFDLVERQAASNAKDEVDYDYIRKIVSEEVDARMSKFSRSKPRKEVGSNE